MLCPGGGACAHLCRTYGPQRRRHRGTTPRPALRACQHPQRHRDWPPARQEHGRRLARRSGGAGGRQWDATRSAAQGLPRRRAEATPAGDAAGTDSPARQFQSWLNANYATGWRWTASGVPRPRGRPSKPLDRAHGPVNKGLAVDGIWVPRPRPPASMCARGQRALTRLIQGTLYCRGYDPRALTDFRRRVRPPSSPPDRQRPPDGIVGKDT